MYQEEYRRQRGTDRSSAPENVFLSGNKEAGRPRASYAALEDEADRISARSLRNTRSVAEGVRNLSRDTGTDLSDVPVQTRDLEEPGYTAGGTVYLDSAVDLSSPSGRMVLGHELVHAAQQSAGSSGGGDAQVSAAPAGMVQHFAMANKTIAYMRDRKYNDIVKRAARFNAASGNQNAEELQRLYSRANKYRNKYEAKDKHQGRRDEITRLINVLNPRREEMLIQEGVDKLQAVIAVGHLREEHRNRAQAQAQDLNLAKDQAYNRAWHAAYNKALNDGADVATATDAANTAGMIAGSEKENEIHALSEDEYAVDRGTLDPAMFYKSARGIFDVAMDFRGVDLRSFKVEDIGAPNADVNATKDMRFSENLEKSNDNTFNVEEDSAGNRTFPTVGRMSEARKAGKKTPWQAASTGFIGTHEMGHVVMQDLRKKIFNERYQNDPLQAKQQAKNDYATRGLADAIMYDAALETMRTNKHFRERAKAQLKKLQKTNANATLEQAITPKFLRKMGYVSQYGKTNPDEVIAEAFAEHYWLKQKRREHATDGKLSKRKYKENPFAKTLVTKMADLYADGGETKRAEFLARHNADIQGRQLNTVMGYETDDDWNTTWRKDPSGDYIMESQVGWWNKDGPYQRLAAIPADIRTLLGLPAPQLALGPAHLPPGPAPQPPGVHP